MSVRTKLTVAVSLFLGCAVACLVAYAAVVALTIGASNVTAKALEHVEPVADGLYHGATAGESDLEALRAWALQDCRENPHCLAALKERHPEIAALVEAE